MAAKWRRALALRWQYSQSGAGFSPAKSVVAETPQPRPVLEPGTSRIRRMGTFHMTTPIPLEPDSRGCNGRLRASARRREVADRGTRPARELLHVLERTEIQLVALRVIRSDED